MQKVFAENGELKDAVMNDEILVDKHNNKKEILFIQDAKYCNPNGDFAENKPRYNSASDKHLISGVSFKRVIRDYLEFVGYPIFIKSEELEDGTIQSLSDRLKDEIKDIESREFENIYEAHNYVKSILVNKYVDTRLFGATIAPKKKDIKLKNVKEFGSTTITGPTQTNILSEGMCNTEIINNEGTGAFASDDNNSQNTIRRQYVVDYSIIPWYWLAHNTDEDVNLLCESMWNGLKHRSTSSKFGQNPRILLLINYKSEYDFIGELNNKVHLTNKDIHDIKEAEFNFDELLECFNVEQDKIESIEYKFDYDFNINIANYNSVNDFINKLNTYSFKVSEIEFKQRY